VAVGILIVGILALLGDLAYAGLGLRTSIQDAADGLSSARSNVSEGNLNAAAGDLSAAEAAAERADALAHHPALVLLSSVPRFGADVNDVQAITKAALLTVRAGHSALAGLEALGVTEGGDVASSLYRDGQVQLAAIESSRPFIDSAHRDLSSARETLAAAPKPFFAPVASGLATARSAVYQATDSAGRGAALLGSLPSLLASGSEKRYLLTFQALGEARATGGVAGLYGVLSAKDGRLDLEHIGPYSELAPTRIGSSQVPDWFLTSYASQSALKQWAQANVSPHFPTVAKVWLAMYRAATGEELDGVVAMDPVALADLLKGTGPITVNEFPQPIGSDNAAEILMHDSYVAFGPQEQDIFLARLVNEFWGRIRSGDVDGAALAEGFGEAVGTQHIKLFSSTATDQAALEATGAAGDYQTAGPNPQMVFTNNYSVNKVDYFLDRSIDTTVALQVDGSAKVTVKTTLKNDAPAGPPSLLLGLQGGVVPPGTNKTMLSFLLPPDSRIRSLTVDGRDVAPLSYHDGNSPIAWTLAEIPAKESLTTVLKYRMPAAITPFGDDGRFAMTLVPQATPTPDDLSLKILAPSGFAVGRINAGVVSGHESALTYSSPFSRPYSVDLAIVAR
jgi:hypothetical protein